MPNCYARLADIREEYQGSGAGTSLDTLLLRCDERASRMIDERTGRHFYSLQGQTVLVPYRPRPQHMDATQLWLPVDIAAITTLKVDQDGDGVYETTLVENTDYRTWPFGRQSNEPIERVDVITTGQISAWPSGEFTVQIVGTRGYSAEVELLTTTTEALDTSETGVDLTAAASPGDTLVIDSEQMDVVSVSSLTATVTRGVNGSTAAAHNSGASVYRRRFPRAIELAATMQAVRFAREVQTGYGGSVANAELAGFSFRAMYPAIRDALEPFILRSAA